MALPNDNIPDRNHQVLHLLQELGTRLRAGDAERERLKREIEGMRETLNDLDGTSGQVQRAYLTLENKFDAHDHTVETIIRRLTGLEESVDRQNTELIGLLRKIEERFGTYDSDHKAQNDNIVKFADQLERFDRRLEKLSQDKARFARKLDSFEFQIAETEDRMKAKAMVLLTDQEMGEGSTASPKPERPMLQVWTPPEVNSNERPPFLEPPVEIPMPVASSWFTAQRRTRIGQAVAGIGLAVVISGLLYGLTSTLIRHPGTTKDVKQIRGVSAVVAAPAPKVEAETKELAKTSLPGNGEPLFSPAIRAQIDQQIVAARKIEDEDTARLMAMTDVEPLVTRLTRDESLSRAIKAIEAKAIEGTREAQHDMGALYTSGQSGVKVDYRRAAFWFREAANNGVANARYNLGVLYQQGLGVEKDISQALSWYRAAALLDHPEARYNLGIAYVEGIGADYNPAMAAGYFEQAARGGVVEAAYNLGLILENGLIDQPRPLEGVFWYRLAADRGNVEAAGALKRVMKEQNLTVRDVDRLKVKMLLQRPDLKDLANGAKARSVGQPGQLPRVRVYASESASLRTQESRTTPPDMPKPAIAASGDPMVIRVQELLAEQGIFTGPVTGQVGPVTTEAIRKYQQKNDLPVDGKATQNLLAHLLAARLKDSEPAAGPLPPDESLLSHPLNN